MYNESTHHEKRSQKNITKISLIKNFMTRLYFRGQVRTIKFSPSVDKSVSKGGVLKRRRFKVAGFERWAIFGFLK